MVVVKGITYRAMNRHGKRAVEIQDHSRNFTLSLNVFIALLILVLFFFFLFGSGEKNELRIYLH